MWPTNQKAAINYLECICWPNLNKNYWSGLVIRVITVPPWSGDTSLGINDSHCFTATRIESRIAGIDSTVAMAFMCLWHIYSVSCTQVGWCIFHTQPMCSGYTPHDCLPAHLEFLPTGVSPGPLRRGIAFTVLVRPFSCKMSETHLKVLWFKGDL